MKHFVLIHNLIMMTHANITNSVEGFSTNDLCAVRHSLSDMVTRCYSLDQLTTYQTEKLTKMIGALIKANQ